MVSGYVRTQSYSISAMEHREKEIRASAEKTVQDSLSLHKRVSNLLYGSCGSACAHETIVLVKYILLREDINFVSETHTPPYIHLDGVQLGSVPC